MSSWQDYVDKHLLASRCVTKAAIAGHDGNVWAKSDGFDVSTSHTMFYHPTIETCMITTRVTLFFFSFFSRPVSGGRPCRPPPPPPHPDGRRPFFGPFSNRPGCPLVGERGFPQPES